MAPDSSLSFTAGQDQRRGRAAFQEAPASLVAVSLPAIRDDYSRRSRQISDNTASSQLGRVFWFSLSTGASSEQGRSSEPGRTGVRSKSFSSRSWDGMVKSSRYWYLSRATRIGASLSTKNPLAKGECQSRPNSLAIPPHCRIRPRSNQVPVWPKPLGREGIRRASQT